MNRNQQWVLLFLSLGLAFLFFLTNPPPAVHESLLAIHQEDLAAASSPAIRWQVEVDGDVKSRGVYDVAPGTTVAEVISKAGGMKSHLSFAPQILSQKIDKSCRLDIVSATEGIGQVKIERLAPKKIPLLALRVNPNLGNRDELDTLPGIGPKIAQDIIEYREKHGPFKTPEDLLQVRGIGPKKLAAIIPRITFDTPPQNPAE